MKIELTILRVLVRTLQPLSYRRLYGEQDQNLIITTPVILCTTDVREVKINNRKLIFSLFQCCDSITSGYFKLNISYQTLCGRYGSVPSSKSNKSSGVLLTTCRTSAQLVIPPKNQLLQARVALKADFDMIATIAEKI